MARLGQHVVRVVSTANATGISASAPAPASLWERAPHSFPPAPPPCGAQEAFSSDYVAQVFGAAPDEAAWREEQLREGALAQHNTRAELGGVPAEWELGMASRATDNEVERLYDALEQDDDEDGFFYGHGEGFEEDGEGEEVASQQV